MKYDQFFKLLTGSAILLGAFCVQTVHAVSILDASASASYPPVLTMKASSGNAHRFIEYSVSRDGQGLGVKKYAQNQYVSYELPGPGIYSFRVRSYDTVQQCVRNGPSLNDVVCTNETVYSGWVSGSTQFKVAVAAEEVTPAAPAATIPASQSCGTNADKIYQNQVCGSSIASTMASAAGFCGACGVQSAPSGSSGCVTVYCGN